MMMEEGVVKEFLTSQLKMKLRMYLEVVRATEVDEPVREWVRTSRFVHDHPEANVYLQPHR